MGTEFQPNKMKSEGCRWWLHNTVNMCLTPLNCTLKNGYDSKFYMYFYCIESDFFKYQG